MRNIEDEAYRRASQAMVAGGWGEYPVGIIGNITEEQYWEEFGEVYEDAMFDIKAETDPKASDQAFRTMAAEGWEGFPIDPDLRQDESKYWTRWEEVYAQALKDLEAENETGN